MFRGAEGINEIGNEIFLFGARFEDFFFVFYDDFVVCYFDDFFSGDGKFGIGEAFYKWATDDDLLDEEIVGIDCEIYKLAELRTFLGFNFKCKKVEIKLEDLFDFDDVGRVN